MTSQQSCLAEVQALEKLIRPTMLLPPATLSLSLLLSQLPGLGQQLGLPLGSDAGLLCALQSVALHAGTGGALRRAASLASVAAQATIALLGWVHQGKCLLGSSQGSSSQTWTGNSMAQDNSAMLKGIDNCAGFQNHCL